MKRKRKQIFSAGFVLLVLTVMMRMTACASATVSSAEELALNSDISWAANKSGPLADSDGEGRTPYDSCKEEFALGSDISWAADKNESFTDRKGKRRKLYDICKNEYGMNTVRLRTWVNNPKGSCSEDNIIAYAKKCSDEGLRVMIDFHYSDDWADPDKQIPPSSWNITDNVSADEAVRIGKELYDYTYSFLTHMKEEGVIPEWVQIGNEITYGMLWPLCHTSNPQNLAYVLQEGIRAVRDASPDTKIVLHVSGAEKTERAVSWYENIIASGVTDFDVLGLSFYARKIDPAAELQAVSETFDQLYSKFCEETGREIMMVEIGANYMEGATIAQKYQMIAHVIKELKNIPNGQGTGCLYWEIEHYEMEKSARYGTEVPNKLWEVFSPDAVL